MTNSAPTFHEINFASAGPTFQGSEASEGQGYLPMDGMFRLTPKAMNIFVKDVKGVKKRHLSVSYAVIDNDLPNIEGTILRQEYLLDGYVKDVTPPKAIAVQSLGRLFMQHGMSEKDAQAALSKLPNLGATSDREREIAFCKAVLGVVTGKTAVAIVKAVAKADGSRLVSVIDKFTTEAALAIAKRDGNGLRQEQLVDELKKECQQRRASRNRGRAAAPAHGAATAPTGEPGPSLNLDDIMNNGASS